jgi:hypothetical protein
VQAYDDDIKCGGFEFLSLHCHGRREPQTIISFDSERGACQKPKSTVSGCGLLRRGPGDQHVSVY